MISKPESINTFLTLSFTEETYGDFQLHLVRKNLLTSLINDSVISNVDISREF